MQKEIPFAEHAIIREAPTIQNKCDLSDFKDPVHLVPSVLQPLSTSLGELLLFSVANTHAGIYSYKNNKSKTLYISSVRRVLEVQIQQVFKINFSMDFPHCTKIVSVFPDFDKKLYYILGRDEAGNLYFFILDYSYNGVSPYHTFSTSF